MACGLKPRGIDCLLIVVGLCLSGLIACEKAVEINYDGQTQGGDINFRLVDMNAQYLEFNDVFQVQEYPRPVLALTVEINNQGDNGFVYAPMHHEAQMTEATTPLLFRQLKVDDAGQPGARAIIRGVVLEDGRYPGQLSAPRTIKPGEKIQDVFLFEVPEPRDSQLVLSFPPAMHNGGNVPALLGFDYNAQAPQRPKIYTMEESINLGKATLRIVDTTVDYVALTKNKEDGFSKEPLLKIGLEIHNTSDQPLNYRGQEVLYAPDENTRPVRLTAKDITYDLIALSDEVVAPSQQREPVAIEPGKKLNDYLLFKVPAKNVGQLRLDLPAHLVGEKGLARFVLPLEYEEPQLPEALQPK